MITLEELYSPQVLALATALGQPGRLAPPCLSAALRSRACGSRIAIDLRLSGGVVSAFAQRVEACALAQASAAVLEGAILGAAVEEVRDARDALRAMLEHGAPPPEGRFGDLRHLAPVRDYPPRHESVLLPFEAACRALASGEGGGQGA